ncbi:MAG: histidine kinase [Bacteroidetes bacterium]|nr:histidine kinase [Bacteroidota bacterium]
MDKSDIILLSFLAFVVAFVFMVFVWYRQKRENDFKMREAFMAREVAEVEMMALRAQINPHFIFNSLNSIYGFVQSNNKDVAAKYLVKFSSLIRMILENSVHKEITLAEDLKVMELYIKMEQLRMQHGFDYKITVSENADTENMMVPPMIIQPFIENSIWHGLNNQTEKGLLQLLVNVQGNNVYYIIEDNGSANSVAEKNEVEAVKKKSMGVSITQQRLDVLNKLKGKKSYFKISDICNAQNEYAGKRVEVVIEN